MGHLINPVSFRLGSSKYWNSLWFVDANSSTFNSLVKSDWVYFLFFKRFLSNKVFYYNGYIFSHVKIVREGYKTCCVVYFYDGSFLEKSEVLSKILFSRAYQAKFLEELSIFIFANFFKRYTSLQYKQYQLMVGDRFIFLFNYFVFKRRKLVVQLILKKKFLIGTFRLLILKLVTLFVNFFQSSLTNFCNTRLSLDYIQDFSKIFELLKRDFFSIRYFLVFLEKSSSFNVKLFLVLVDKLLIYFKFFANFSGIFANGILFLQSTGLIVSSLLLQYFWRFKRFVGLSVNLDFFFSKILSSYFNNMKFLIFKKSVFLYSFLKLNLERSVYANRYFSHYFPEYFFVLSKFRNNFGSLARYYLNLIFGASVSDRLNIVWKMLHYNNFSAQIVANYISIRLRQRFQLREIIMPILRSLSAHPSISGFRISCAGRFTKKEIASYDLRTYSSVPFSTVSKRLDYALSEVVLKYSICGVKVWLHKRIYLDDLQFPRIENYADFSDFFLNLKNFSTGFSFRFSQKSSNFDSWFIQNFIKIASFVERDNFVKKRIGIRKFLSRTSLTAALVPISGDFFFDRLRFSSF